MKKQNFRILLRISDFPWPNTIFSEDSKGFDSTVSGTVVRGLLFNGLPRASGPKIWGSRIFQNCPNSKILFLIINKIQFPATLKRDIFF